MITLRTHNLTDEEVDVRVSTAGSYVRVSENGELLFEGVIQSMAQLLNEINSHSKRCRYELIADADTH